MQLGSDRTSIQVGADLIVFGHDDPLPMIRFSGLDRPETTTRKELKPAGVGREWFTTVSLEKNGSQPIIFLVSGSFYSGEMTAMVLAYDLESETTMNVPDLNTARWDHINCIVGDYLCIVGGKDISGSFVNSTELLDLTKLKDDWSGEKSGSSWSMIRDTFSQEILVPRICCQLKYDQLLVMGF